MDVDLISDDVVFHVYTRGYSGLLCLQFFFSFVLRLWFANG